MRAAHLLPLLFCVVVNGQQFPPKDASKLYSNAIFQQGLANTDKYYGIAQDSQGLLYVAGITELLNYTQTYPPGNMQFVKMTSNFEILNSTVFGSPTGDDTITSMVLIEESSLLISCGRTTGSLFASNPSRSSNAFVFAMDASNFSTVWSLQFNNITASFTSVAFNPSNNTELYVFGTSRNSFPLYGQSNAGSDDWWILKLNSEDGSIVWMRLLGSTASEDSWGMKVDSLGYLYFVGTFFDDIPQFNITWMASHDAIYGKMDSQGNFIWVKPFQSGADDRLRSLSLGNEDKLYLCGDTTGNFSRNGTALSTPAGNQAVVVMETDSVDGAIQWVSVVPALGGSQVAAFCTNINFGLDEKLYASGLMSGESFAGVSRERPSVDFDFLFAVYNRNGTQIDYVSIVGTSVSEENYGLLVDNNMTVYIIGSTGGNLNGTNAGTGTDDAVIVKYTPSKSSSKDNHKSETTVIAAVVASLTGFFIVAGVAAFCFVKTRNRSITLQYEEESPAIPTRVQSQAPAQSRQGTPLQTKPRENTQFNSVEMKESAQSGLGGSVGPAVPRRKGTDNLKNDWMIAYEEIVMEKKIGVGAFGEVYKGLWRGIEVAVKQLLEEDGAPSNLAVQDFFAEAELMKKLRPHPNITLLLGVCSSPLCIITEFVTNGSLWTWLQSNKPMNNDMKVNIIRGIAAGMLHLHSEGVIHRDLAARNILLDENLNPKVSDFGLSRVVLDNASAGKTQATTGPIKWMAPEALLDKVYNTRTDIWSFGIVIYEVLVRKTPYHDHDFMQVGTKVALGKLNLTEEIQKEEAVGTYPEVLLALMKQCLRYSGPDRPEFQEVIAYMDSHQNQNESIL